MSQVAGVAASPAWGWQWSSSSCHPPTDCGLRTATAAEVFPYAHPKHSIAHNPPTPSRLRGVVTGCVRCSALLCPPRLRERLRNDCGDCGRKISRWASHGLPERHIPPVGLLEGSLDPALVAEGPQ